MAAVGKQNRNGSCIKAT